MGKLSRLKPMQDPVKAKMPGWNCYCCHDTGFVVRQELVLDGFCDGSGADAYSPSDYPLICKACSASAAYMGLGLDDRLSVEGCRQIHKTVYDAWMQSVQAEAGVESPTVKAVARVASAREVPRDERNSSDLVGIGSMVSVVPEKEKAIAVPNEEECEGFKIGDRVKICLDSFGEEDQRQIAKEDGVPVGECGVIKSFRFNPAGFKVGMKQVLAAVMLNSSQEIHEYPVDYFRRDWGSVAA